MHTYDPLTRRRLFAGAAAIGAAALAAACGSDETSNATSPTTSPSRADTVPPTEGTRSVTDEFGAVEVPASPQRVAFMDMTTFGNALALGFPAAQIVGAGFAGLDPATWPYLDDIAPLEQFEDSGDINLVNVEAIAGLEPDLIVQLSLFDEARTQLRAIGPPVYTALNGYNSIDEMMELLRDTGDVLGLQDKAAELEADFRARVESIVAKFEGNRPSVTAIRLFDAADVWTQAHPVFDLMELPRTSPPPPELFEQLSAERIDAADGDILWVSGSVGIEEAKRIVEANPLWASMNAVKTGMVRYVEDQPWGTDYSYPALVIILDEIQAGLDAYLAAR